MDAALGTVPRVRWVNSRSGVWCSSGANSAADAAIATGIKLSSVGGGHGLGEVQPITRLRVIARAHSCCSVSRSLDSTSLVRPAVGRMVITICGWRDKRSRDGNVTNRCSVSGGL